MKISVSQTVCVYVKPSNGSALCHKLSIAKNNFALFKLKKDLVGSPKNFYNGILVTAFHPQTAP